MKRFICLLAVALFVGLQTIAWAAGACTFTHTSVDDGHRGLEVTVVCTADAGAASYPVTLMPYDAKGMYLFSVNTYFDAVTPATDNSDLAILDAAAGKDILNGGGTNQVDIAANNHFKPIVNDPTGTASDTIMPVFTPLYVKLTGNAVNSAVVTIVLKFIE